MISVTPKAPAGTVTDKVKNRLEQLDDFEEVLKLICAFNNNTRTHKP